MTERLQGKVALVTGAGSGIGAAIARRFAQEGASIVAADRDRAALIGMAAEVRSRFTPLHVDVTDEPSVIAMIDAAHAQGGPDILVNVAGIGSTTDAPGTSLDTWHQVMAVNAGGTFLTCKHAIPRMIERRGGAIVNMASVAALVGLRRRAAYCASKGAVVALTRALAVDHVADGIRVNCICPGTVDSPWVRRLVADAGESLDDLRSRQPMGRLGTPAEIAEAALFLSEDNAAFTTGTALVIDGGMTAA